MIHWKVNLQKLRAYCNKRKGLFHHFEERFFARIRIFLATFCKKLYASNLRKSTHHIINVYYVYKKENSCSTPLSSLKEFGTKEYDANKKIWPR